MLRQLSSPAIVHIPTGTRCNNRCNFCMERSAGYPVTHSLAEYRETLERMRAELDEVVFTGGEPTLNPLLPDLIGAAAALDYRTIGLVTNARRLERRDHAERLLAAGLNKVTISLHGPRAAVHDEIARRAGSFDQAVRGVQQLSALRDRYPLALSMNCSLVQSNLGLLREMRDFALGLGVDHINFNVVEPRGHADALFSSVVPRYADVMTHADDSGLDFSASQQSLSRVPACAGGVEWVQEQWHLARGERVDVYDPAEGKVHGPPCQSCALARTCPGIWRRYVEGYGWDEFAPVCDPSVRRGQTWRLRAGAPCNNRCVHCVDGPAGPPPTTPVHPSRQLRDGLLAGYRRVELSGGELLLDERLPRLVASARNLGYEAVALVTNGRALALGPVVERLRGLGLDEVVVTLNAGNEAVHDAMAQVPGAFRQSIKGMLRLRRHGIPFTVRLRRDRRNESTIDRARQLALEAGAARFEVAR